MSFSETQKALFRATHLIYQRAFFAACSINKGISYILKKLYLQKEFQLLNVSNSNYHQQLNI